MSRKLIALLTGLLTAALMFGVVSPATAAPKKVTPEVSLATPKKNVTVGAKVTFKGKVSTKRAAGAKVTVQRKTTKGWKAVKTKRVSKNAKYKVVIKVSAKGKHTYRVKVAASKKTRAAYSRKVTINGKPSKALDRERTAGEKAINKFRKKHGKKPITLHPVMNKVAQWLAVKVSAGSNPTPWGKFPSGYGGLYAHTGGPFGAAYHISKWVSHPKDRDDFLSDDYLYGVGYHGETVALIIGFTYEDMD